MSIAPTLRREELYRALGGNMRLVRAFEDQARTVDETSGIVTSTISATDAIQDATVLTLSPNGAFTNERVLGLGEGLEGEDDGAIFSIRLSASAPIVSGGFTLNIVVEGDSTVRIPLSGQLATTSNPETLSNKTIAAPILSGLGDYADDAAAAVGSVPVGGMYRTGSTLKIRVI